MEHSAPKILANGQPFGFDFGDAVDNVEVTLDGFKWSEAFSVEKSAEVIGIS